MGENRAIARENQDRQRDRFFSTLVIAVCYWLQSKPMATEHSVQDADSRPNGDNPRSLKGWIDTFTNTWVLLLASIYAAGFVIVSEYRSSFGLNTVAPLRPQVAATGVVFGGVIAVSYFVMEWAFGPVRQISKPLSVWRTLFFKLSFGFLYLFLNDLLAALMLQLVFRFWGTQRLPIAFPITAAALWTVIAAIVAAPRPGWATNIFGHPISMVLSVLLLLFLAGESVPLHGEFGIRQFALYLFLIQAAVKPIRKALQGVSKSNWVTHAGALLLPVLAYGVFIYPHVRAAFGGGETVTVSMRVANRNGPTHPPESLTDVKVIDETEEGFYVLESGGTTVTFIPRTSVYSIQFVKPAKVM